MAPKDLWTKKVKQPDGSYLEVPSRRYGRGKRWRVTFIDPLTNTTKTEHFDKKTGKGGAEDFENRTKAAISEGRYFDPDAGKVLVADYADQWISRLQKRPQTRKKYAGDVENHIKPVLGTYTMAQVRSGTIQDWVTNRRTAETDRKPLAASTLRTIYSCVLYPIFKRAVIDQVIPAHPCVDIVLPELPDGVYDVPTVVQVDSLATGMGDYYGSTVHLAAGCGLRTGEVFGLELDAVDFLRRVVHVRHQLLMSVTGGPHLGPLKTRTSKRTVELPTVACEWLARHVELHPPEPVLIWDRTNPEKPRQRKARLLWLDTNGRPMRGSPWTALWRAGVDAAELPADTFTMRSLRHFFATALIYAGKNVKTVQMAMGHAKPTTTLETYLGYWPEDERDGTRLVLDAVFEVLSDESYTRSVPNDLVRR